MSTEPEGWAAPKTDWIPDDTVGHSDLNRWEGNSGAIETGERTLDPAQAPSSNKGSLRQILDWLANRIKAITGATNWYDAPATTLAAAKSGLDNAASHASAASPHSGHATTTALNNHAGANITSSNTVHGIKQGSGNGFDADTLDGKHWVQRLNTTTTVAASESETIAIPSEFLGHHHFLISVYSDTIAVLPHQRTAVSGSARWFCEVQQGLPPPTPGNSNHRITLHNDSPSSVTFNINVLEWC